MPLSSSNEWLTKRLFWFNCDSPGGEDIEMGSPFDIDNHNATLRIGVGRGGN